MGENGLGFFFKPILVPTEYIIIFGVIIVIAIIFLISRAKKKRKNK